jgi:hypothetical protein
VRQGVRPCIGMRRATLCAAAGIQFYCTGKTPVCGKVGTADDDLFSVPTTDLSLCLRDWFSSHYSPG